MYVCVYIYIYILVFETVSLVHDDWCWKQKTLDVELIDKDVSDIRFEHNGYILSISTSHDVQLVSNIISTCHDVPLVSITINTSHDYLSRCATSKYC